jgi:hypothetical protein
MKPILIAREVGCPQELNIYNDYASRASMLLLAKKAWLRQKFFNIKHFS